MNCDNCGGCKMNCEGCSRKTNNKLDTFDWLCDIPASREVTDYVEVTFKNTRKGYFRNTNGLKLTKGDLVAVEATPGHDIGTVSLVGQLVLLQMKKNKIDPLRSETKKIYRIARDGDLEKFEEAKAREHETMLKARKIAEDLHLNMKIGDVEYQGDGNKAIFYYIADERVDFRQLIKVLAETFRVKIEMRQIGARQEAGRIGGIGPCGRPLCCSSWMSNFVSVSTTSARYQEISLNPQKLAGQCAKLKCCLNFELDSYIEAQKDIPPRNIPLETKDGNYYHFKTDVFGKTMQYSSDPHVAANIVTIPADRVKEILALNKQGVKVDRLVEEEEETVPQQDYENVVGQDSLTRFDKKKKHKQNGNNHGRGRDRDQRGATDDTHNGEPAAQEEQTAPAGNAETNNGGNAPAGNGGNRNANDNQRRDRRDNQRRDNRDRRDRRDDRDRRPNNADRNNGARNQNQEAAGQQPTEGNATANNGNGNNGNNNNGNGNNGNRDRNRGDFRRDRRDRNDNRRPQRDAQGPRNDNANNAPQNAPRPADGGTPAQHNDTPHNDNNSNNGDNNA